MIVVGYLGMTVHFWFTTTWLWYLLRRPEEPFGTWFISLYGGDDGTRTISY